MASTALLVHAHIPAGAAFVCRLFKTMAVAPAEHIVGTKGAESAYQLTWAW